MQMILRAASWRPKKNRSTVAEAIEELGFHGGEQGKAEGHMEETKQEGGDRHAHNNRAPWYLCDI